MKPLRRKLIETSLPLEDINKAAAREKSIRHGHPSTLHLWWARRPLAAARAVIFAQMVDDPASWPDLFPTEAAQKKERDRLHRIIKDLVVWENSNNPAVLQAARDEIWQSWRRACADNADHPRAAELFDRNKLPGFHDPFAGGGALPLEAQRLGLEVTASDLNPVAVLINKAMIELPPRFAGQPPIHPAKQGSAKPDQAMAFWHGAAGLAEDVRYYGQWMRDQAEKRIGHLYPRVTITADMARRRPDLKPYLGRDLTVIAWLWARTVPSPHPSFANVPVPLASTFQLSAKPGKEAYVQPILEHGSYRFEIRLGKNDAAASGTKLGRGANFRCLLSDSLMDGDFIKAHGQAGRMGTRLMAVVCEGTRSRLYLDPSDEMEAVARSAKPAWRPEGEVPARLTGGTCVPYGLRTWADLFTPRQLVALTTFSDLVAEARSQALADGASPAYADALATYLALATSRAADAWSSGVTWRNGVEATRGTFARQALPMCWDFTEANPFSRACGNWDDACLEWVVEATANANAAPKADVSAVDATLTQCANGRLVSTDPPYYDNVGYADLSDYFYTWLRHTLRHMRPDLFSTVATPKARELVATPYRHGGKKNAEAFFLDGMKKAMHNLAEQAHPAFPVTIYYAFKQSEERDDLGDASTGWETFLEAVIEAGFGVGATLPLRTERQARTIGLGTNALASSIVLACRARPADLPRTGRQDFVAALKRELPPALRLQQRSNIAPVDLAQAAIGPGMAVFTRFSQVLNPDGSELRVREALALINGILDETVAEQEGDLDAESRWALAWFEQFGFEAGDYGVAETLSRAKNTDIRLLADAGLATQGRGKVQLVRPAALAPKPKLEPAAWTVWEATHRLIRALDEQGEDGGAQLLAALGPRADAARDLAYRLYNICERKRRPADALGYNALVQSWGPMGVLAQTVDQPRAPEQLALGTAE